VVVADEIQSGFGRTGAFLGVDHYNFRPDVVMLGPAGAAGLPFAAVVAPAQLFERSGPWRLSQVSPLVCAAAYGVLVGLTEPVQDNVVEMGNRLDGVIAELSDQFSEVAGITGSGLLRQLHLTRPDRAERFRRDCRARGLLLGPDLVLTPPLTVTADEVDVVADVMAEVLMEWRAA
jgi:4-aminobutyrate aminotransferase-like enzyme